MKYQVMAAAGLALAFSLHVTMVFFALAVFVWFFFLASGEGSRLRALGRLLIPGTMFLFTYALIAFAVFGVHAPEALLLHLQTYFLEQLYIGSFSPETWRIFLAVLVGSPLPWILVAISIGTFHVKWVAKRMINKHTLLLILLTDAALLFLLLRDRNFEQHYIPVVLFGSVLAALMIVEWERKLEMRMGCATSGVVGLVLAILLLLSTSAMAMRTHRRIIELDKQMNQELVSSFRVWGQQKNPEGPEAVRRWLKERPAYFDPYMYRPKKQIEAQIRFLLEESKPGQILLTDWLNPPYRHLPAGYNHGYMLSLFYASQRLRTDPDLLRLVRRYDPYYTPGDHSTAEHMIRLMEAVPPRLILLDGSLARLFFNSDLFSHWVSERYRFVLERQSGSVFAVAKDVEK